MTRRAIATEKAEATRDRILDTALRLFRERGFDETTMRDVASEAGVATGAAYYYFRSKNDIVMAFYERTATEMNARAPELLAKSTDLKTRIRMIIDAKFEQFVDHRRLLAALIRAADPSDPLSPFGDETRVLREEHIGIFRQVIAGSKTKIPKDLADWIPRLLWLYQMGLLLFWIFDRSPRQRKTEVLESGTVDIIVRLLQLSSLPLMGGVRRSVTRVLESTME